MDFAAQFVWVGRDDAVDADQEVAVYDNPTDAVVCTDRTAGWGFVRRPAGWKCPKTLLRLV